MATYYNRNATPLQFCCVCMPADQIGVWECCQEYKGIVEPGCRILGCNCCGACITIRAVSTRVVENQCMCETKTRDNVFVQITAAVQMQPNLRNVRDAIYKLNDPTQQVTSYVADVVRAEVPKMTLDQVFENKDAIALAVATKITEKMGKFGYNILQALVTNVEPDSKVKQALNNVEAANKDRTAQETKAKAAHFVAVKKAEAEAESKALQGQGIAKQRAAIVDGLRESIGFSEGEGAAKQVSELLLVTQYFDTLEKISEGKSSTIFIPHSVGGVSDVASNIRNGILQANPPGQGGYGFN
jgi:regulator of protease activity HflC (stomatin/prohibitin superfamily)